MPLESWLRGPLQEWATERCQDESLLQKVPLDQSAVISLLALHESAALNVHPLMWTVLMLLDYADEAC